VHELIRKKKTRRQLDRSISTHSISISTPVASSSHVPCLVCVSRYEKTCAHLWWDVLCENRFTRSLLYPHLFVNRKYSTVAVDCTAHERRLVHVHAPLHQQHKERLPNRIQSGIACYFSTGLFPNHLCSPPPPPRDWAFLGLYHEPSTHCIPPYNSIQSGIDGAGNGFVAETATVVWRSRSNNGSSWDGR
jgi:hypothetical protein